MWLYATEKGFVKFCWTSIIETYGAQKTTTEVFPEDTGAAHGLDMYVVATVCDQHLLLLYSAQDLAERKSGIISEINAGGLWKFHKVEFCT